MRRILVVLFVIFAASGLATAEVQSDCTSGTCVYLPLVVKAPTNKVIVSSSSTFVPYEGSSSLYLVGEVLNDTNSNVRFVKINAILRDSAGQIVDGDYSYSHIDRLTPGMVSAFRLIFSSPPAWETYELTVTWSTTDQSPYELEIINPEAYFDSSNAYHVRGTVRNQYEAQRTFVKVLLTMYDYNNQVIGAEYGYTNPSTLEPRQEVPFDLDAYFWKYKPDRGKVTRYTIRAFDD
jgi:hypothetical protein